MMDDNYQEEVEAIKQERGTYSFPEKPGVMFFHYLSSAFILMGFVSLILVFFTDVTLVNATCLFIIGYVLAPTDVDLNRLVIKGATEDLANIRVNTAVINKSINSNKKTYNMAPHWNFAARCKIP